MLGTVSEAYRTAVECLAAVQGLEIVPFGKGESKEAIAQAHLARFAGTHGVVLIGKAQEKAGAYKGRPERRSKRFSTVGSTPCRGR